MHLSAPRALLALPFLTFLIAAAPASAAPSSGVQVSRIVAPASAEAIGHELDLAKRAGASFVRTEVVWNRLEPDAPKVQDPAYVATTDMFFQLADAKGLKVVVTMLGTPCWASSAPASKRKGCTGGGKNGAAVTSYPPRIPADFARAAAFVAGRYARQLQGFEVWNEPDQANELYFAGPRKAKRYAALLRAAYPALKAAAPDVPVLGGAIVGADGRFLRALYTAGIKGSYDALSVHYYDLVLGSLRYIRSVQKAHGDTKPLWLGEFGWTSCYPKAKRQGGHDCVTRAVQAESLGDIFRGLRTTTYVLGTVVYSLADSSGSQFGLLTTGGVLKPAFAAVQRAERNPGKPRAVKLTLARRGASVVASGSGPAGDTYQLEVRQAGQLRYRVVFRLARGLTYRFVLPAQLGTRGLQVRVFQHWLGGGTLRSI